MTISLNRIIAGIVMAFMAMSGEVCAEPIVYANANTEVHNNTTAIVEARGLMESFRSKAMFGLLAAEDYDKLFDAGMGYMQALQGERSGSAIYNECKKVLKEIYPRIADGAYFFQANDNNDRVLKFACMYVDIALLPCMGNENLHTSLRFGTLANLAATRLFKTRMYDRAIAYLQAYLECGEYSAREQAFEKLAMCYYQQHQYGHAANIAYQASKQYPGNWNILLIGIEAAGHNGNDPEMGEMLEMALRIQPAHPGLLEYQGKLYERQRKYDLAAKNFEQLCALPNAKIDHITHLGFDSYNAATLAYTRAKAKGDDEEMSRAMQLFGTAAPQLQKVLNNAPHAANVANALALCYSVGKDKARFEEANRVLSNLNAPKVDFDALPTIVQSYTPSADLAAAPAATTMNIANGVEEKLISDVDIDIPETTLTNSHTCAIIIANENYTSQVSSKVDFALRDGQTMAEYCRKILGVPADRVKFYPNATYLTMRNALRDISELSAMRPGKLNVVFYYAGHGMPDQIGENSYLLPVDSDGRDPEFMFSLEKIYADFDKMKARNVTVFLDACFSGQGRDAMSVYAARFVARDAAEIAAKGNTVVFSAGSGTQVSNPYKEQGHGFFTYFLLKALKESKGRITLGELHRRLADDVSFEVLNRLGATQTPTLKVSETLGASWETRTLLD